MTSIPDPHHDREEILMKLLSGQLDPDQGEGRTLLDQDCELKNEFDKIRALTQRLEQAGSLEFDAVANLSEELPPSPLVEKTLKKIWKAEKGGALFPIRLLAAACILLLIAGWYFLRDNEDFPVQYLGEALSVTSPQGEVDRFSFSWQEFALPPGGQFVLLIDVGQGPDEVWRGTENKWEPLPSQEAALPDRIEWWVEAFGPNDFDPMARSKTVTLIRRTE